MWALDGQIRGKSSSFETEVTLKRSFTIVLAVLLAGALATLQASHGIVKQGRMDGAVRWHDRCLESDR